MPIRGSRVKGTWSEWANTHVQACRSIDDPILVAPWIGRANKPPLGKPIIFGATLQQTLTVGRSVSENVGLTTVTVSSNEGSVGGVVVMALIRWVISQIVVIPPVTPIIVLVKRSDGVVLVGIDLDGVNSIGTELCWCSGRVGNEAEEDG